MRPRGGIIGASITPTLTAASGVWTLREAESYNRAAIWPKPFLPSNITGLTLWLDASNASSLYDAASGGSVVSAGGAIGRWQDLSGNALHFTASGSARPTLTGAALNGKNVVTFNGSSNQLTNSTNIINSPTSSPVCTIIAVVKRTGGTYGGFITSLTDDKSPGMLIESGAIGFRAGGGAIGAGIVTGSSAFTGPSVVSCVTSAFVPSLYVNKTLLVAGTGGYGSSSSTTTAIGTYRTEAANFLNGYIAEMVVYNSALSTTDRNSVETWMMAKWSIS
jgi:hypothetical protein